MLLVGVAAGSLLFFRGKHALTAKDTVVLADFTNSTGDPVFDETLRQGLAVELEPHQPTRKPVFGQISRHAIGR